MPKGPNEGILHDVEGLGLFESHVPHVREHLVLMPVHQRAERIPVPREHPGHQSSVGRVRHGRPTPPP